MIPPFPADVERRAASSRRLATAAAASLGAHALVLGVLALFTGLGAAGPGDPFRGTPLRATLVASQPSAPAVEVMPLPTPTPHAPVAEAAVTAPLPVPLSPRRGRSSPPLEASTGYVSITTDESATLDPATEAALAASHPGAVRGTPQFAVEPVGRYPEAARRARQQLAINVVIVVQEDGTIAVVEGTSNDAVFGPVIEESLAAAKAEPPQVNGQPRPIWTVLTYYFESYGAGESLRSKFERKE